MRLKWVFCGGFDDSWWFFWFSALFQYCSNFIAIACSVQLIFHLIIKNYEFLLVVKYQKQKPNLQQKWADANKNTQFSIFFILRIMLKSHRKFGWIIALISIRPFLTILNLSIVMALFLGISTYFCEIQRKTQLIASYWKSDEMIYEHWMKLCSMRKICSSQNILFIDIRKSSRVFVNEQRMFWKFYFMFWKFYFIFF